MNIREALQAVRVWKHRFELLRSRARAEGNEEMKRFCEDILRVYERNNSIINERGGCKRDSDEEGI